MSVWIVRAFYGSILIRLEKLRGYPLEKGKTCIMTGLSVSRRRFLSLPLFLGGGPDGPPFLFWTRILLLLIPRFPLMGFCALAVSRLALSSGLPQP